MSSIAGGIAAKAAKPRGWLASIDVFAAGLALIVAVQSVWLTILMRTGWYYQADFANLAAATGRSLDWSYLTSSQGGHLDIGGRLVLWLLNRTIPLNYNATIALRVVAAAAVTYLLGRLLRELVGPRRGVLALLLLFALSPLPVQSTLWLTSAINFLLSELLVLGALRSHVRYAVTGRLRWAAWTGAAMLGATIMAEQAAVTALALPVLTFAFLSEGPVRSRLRAVLRSWPAWLMIAVPILAFASYYFGSGNYTPTAGPFHASDAVRLVRAFWFDTLIPALFGGPLSWRTLGANNFTAYAAASHAERVIAVGLLALAIAWTVRRTSARALYGWAIPALVSAIGLVFVGRARYGFFGLLVARRFEYAAYAAVPAAVGIALAIWATSVLDIRMRVAGDELPVKEKTQPSTWTAVQRWSALAVVVAVGALSVISGRTYTHYWSESQSQAYVDRLSAGLSQQGDSATVFDTFVAGDVVVAIEQHRNVSDLLALMGSHAHLNNGPVPAQIVNNDGELVPATFRTTGSVHLSHATSSCPDRVVGQTQQTQRITRVRYPNQWFLRLTYVGPVPTTLDVHAVTAQGTTITPIGGSNVSLGAGAGSVYVHLPESMPVAVQIQGATAATNVCLNSITVGYPFPADGS